MLKLYSNIKTLRKAHNMSQQELAEAVGYKGKSMIAQVESGKVNLPASMITRFAEVFHVTELELMGLDSEEDIKDHFIASYVQNAKDKELVFRYNNADPAIRAAIDLLLKSGQSGAADPNSTDDKGQ